MRLAQLDRAFGYGPKGRGFESSNARYFKSRNSLTIQRIPAFFCAYFLLGLLFGVGPENIPYENINNMYLKNSRDCVILFRKIISSYTQGGKRGGYGI